MWGYEFAGLPRILVIAERPELKKPRTPVTIVKETANSALLDGGNNLGYVALLRAVEVATEKVRSAGIAIIGLRNTWFSGRNAYYMENRPLPPSPSAAARRRSCPLAPRARCWARIRRSLPGKIHPFIFDTSTAAVMSGEVLMKAFLGEEVQIVGIDRNGTPTRVARDIGRRCFHSAGTGVAGLSSRPGARSHRRRAVMSARSRFRSSFRRVRSWPVHARRAVHGGTGGY